VLPFKLVAVDLDLKVRRCLSIGVNIRNVGINAF
jgi:hypothetical protein